MAALTQGRLTPRRAGDFRDEPLHGATTVFAGAMVMRDADGFLVEGQTATGLVGVGVADRDADNGAGADGDITCRYKPGTYRMANSAAADAIDQADIGELCYAVDDQTVALTDATGTRSPAGIIEDVDSDGVWVRFDEFLTKHAAVAAQALADANP